VYEYRANIVRVIDGDTVVVDIDLGFGVWLHKRHIRLYGIDAPACRTRDLDEKKYGFMSKEFLEKELEDGAILKTRLDGKGKYGRILGEFITIKETEAGTDANGSPVPAVPWANGSPVAAVKYRHNVNEHMIASHHAVTYHGKSKEQRTEEHLINRTFFED